MSIITRNNVRITGNGAATMMFAHGFGCDQTMWRFMAPAFADRYRTLTYDLTGSGGSDCAPTTAPGTAACTATPKMCWRSSTPAAPPAP